ncbi:MAG: (2Fe-2S)-binding protein [Acidobacteria bacterium]|nr:(2Fe-2S)-binding protein [Acidobacteriota bacterium]
MTTNKTTEFENFIRGQDEAAWSRALDALLPSIHEVDRNATRIWFAFFPLALARALEQADDPDELARKLLLQGDYRLDAQIDASHRFLYGHRYWRETKAAVLARAAAFAFGADASLADEVRAVARPAAERARADESLLVGISAVALMTLAQVGQEKFAATPGEAKLGGRLARQSPAGILRERERDDSQGLLGFLRTTDRRWTVVWDENRDGARFKMVDRQEVASAAASDKRDYSQTDPRCTAGEGPIPVQCRSASCGTCWVGVVAGAEKLSPVEERERKLMPQLGYLDTDDPRPLIRLSCQARGAGAVTVAVPPWNGVFGKYLRRARRQGGATANAQAAGD